MTVRDAELPTIRVSAILIVDDRVILAKQGRGDQEYWLLPGGGVEFGESMTEALERELHEELGCAFEVTRPVALVESISPDLDAYRKHVLHVLFAGTLGDGPLVTGDTAIRDIAAISANELTGIDLRPPIADFLLGCLRDLPRGIVYLGRRW